MKSFGIIAVLSLSSAGVFAGPNLKEHPLPTHPSDPSVVDVDGDGDLDIMGASESGVFWLENTDKKARKLKERKIPGTTVAEHVDVAGNIDGDKDMDLIHGAPLTIFANNGRKWEKREIDSEFFASSAVVIDVDGDGDSDIVAGDFRGYGMKWFANEDGKGKTWSEAKVFFDHREISYSAELVDLDGDGDQDLLTHFGGETVWLENPKSKSGQWKAHSIHKGERRESPKQLSATDIDGDGDLDVVTADGMSVKIWANNGKGEFAAHGSVSYNMPNNVAAGDFDGDSDNDLVVGSGNDNDGLAFFENQGKGTFKAKATKITKPWSSRALVAADVDGDGDIDLVGRSFSVSDDARRAAWFENVSKRK